MDILNAQAGKFTHPCEEVLVLSLTKTEHDFAKFVNRLFKAILSTDG